MAGPSPGSGNAPAVVAFIQSVNVGRPRNVAWQGEAVSTGIYKAPVRGPVRVSFLNLDGDRQADLTVHGGPYKAVYAYPTEHYAYWRAFLRGRELNWGEFGENLTTSGLVEDDVFVGDRFRIGSAAFEVTQPRVPCYKLGIKFEDLGMVKRFLHSRRTGFYLKVVEEGELTAADKIERTARGSISISDVLRAAYDNPADPALIRRAAAADGMPENWRAEFRQRLARAD
jgi:MOSC domain-containing protein YiiM